MAERTRERVRTASNPKWIRAKHHGRTIVDSKNVTFVWEVPYYPAWYFPVDDIAVELRENGETLRSPSRGEGTRYDVVIQAADGSEIIRPNMAWRHLDSPVEALRDLVRFEWAAFDTWMEEDVEVFVHPRSPEVRIDILPSSRHVEVFLGTTRVADSHRASVLYERDLPPRYYLPKVDIDMTLLTPTDSESACPYKGWANYWTATVDGVEYQDIAWGYRTPLPESAGIAGLVSFYNEKVKLRIDGVELESPKTKFS
ncbi:MAG: DUF427 domain-containing protein [Acidimicrobiia bacterium]|nr:DUF427 domain-containing protein [Acidimicrobiia bacterium]